jgi:hypothetical protein
VFSKIPNEFSTTYVPFNNIFWHLGKKKEKIYWAFGSLALNTLVQGFKTFLP